MNHRSRPFWIALACVLLAALPPLLPAQSGAPQDAASTKTLLIGLGEDPLPPFQFTSADGQPAGLLLDLWKVWAKRTGVRVQFRLFPWADALERFKKGEGDFLFAAIQTPERDQWLDFTQSYFSGHVEVFVKTGSPPFQQLDELQGLRIGAVKEDFGQIYLHAHLPRGATESGYPDLPSMIAAAAAGKIDAFIGYQYIVDYCLAQHSEYRLFRALPVPLAAMEVHAAVRKGNAPLLALLNRGLSEISPVEREAITMQWNAGAHDQAALSFNQQVAIGAALAAFAVALIVVFRRRTTQRLASLMSGMVRTEKEKEQAVAEMHFNERRLRAFTETLSGVLFILDDRGTYIDIFGSEDQLLAAPRPMLLGRTVEQALPPDAANPIMIAVKGAIQSRMLQEVEYSLDVPAGRRTFEGRVSYIPESQGGRPMVVFLALDVTEQKQLGEQLRQAQKMEAIGRLAGGVAHDFNNILTAIIGFAGMAAEDVKDPEQTRQHIEEIRAGAERAATLTKQLLAFSRRQALSPERLDLNRVVMSMEKMLRRLIGEDVILRTDLAPDLAPVLADPGQIDQVLLNLAINGRDAMPHGGRLLLATRNLDLRDQSFGPTVALHPGFYVVLEVADTGIGMDEATSSHIFEPFFTTKERDKGTGLGLSTVYGIVKQSGGDIDCASRPGQGTSFRIYLPRTSIPASVTVSRTAPIESPETSESGTVMIVEDDDVIRLLICRLLRSRGYTVLDAADAPAALELFERFGDAVQLLISDVVMPGMRGPELVRRVLRDRPRVRALLISGYTDGEMVSPDAVASGVEFLQKPFQNDELLARVRRILIEAGDASRAAAPRN